MGHTRIIIGGTVLKTAEIHDKFWLHLKDIPLPHVIIEQQKKLPKVADFLISSRCHMDLRLLSAGLDKLDAALPTRTDRVSAKSPMDKTFSKTR